MKSQLATLTSIRRPSSCSEALEEDLRSQIFGVLPVADPSIEEAEVFILARMREEYDVTGSTNEAVVRGIGRTGRLVTSAALILFLAFTSLASGPNVGVKIIGTGLGAGILLDATVVRMLLVPALVSLFGRWNWWLPSFPARLLRVEPSLIPVEVVVESFGPGS